uniref:ZAD domain-containing protein n=1 Tax=Anopheles dirus TaxID=7168 RepID=A0A3F2YVX8_9DIPT
MASRVQDHSQCRFCLVDIESTEAAGINLMQASDLPVIALEVYGVEISTTDPYSTTICVPCFQALIKNHTHRVRNAQLKRIYKLNQLVLSSQVNASIASSAVAIPAEASSSAVSSRSTSPVDGAYDDTIAAEVATGTASEPPPLPFLVRQLVPVAVDCLKESDYLAALWPIVVTLDADNAKPLVYLCNTCKKKFDTKDAYESHRTRSCCVPCCRYCQSKWTEDHRCAFQTKYAPLMPHILGGNRYLTEQVVPLAGRETPSHNEKPTIVTTPNEETTNQAGDMQKKHDSKTPRSSRSRSTSERRLSTAPKQRANESAKRKRTDSNVMLPAEQLELDHPYTIDISSEDDLSLTELLTRAPKAPSQKKKKRKNW